MLIAALITGAEDDDDEHHQHDGARWRGRRGSDCDDEADCGRGSCVERMG